MDDELSAEAADGWRDALAILGSALEGDEEAVGTVIVNSPILTVVGALATMLFRELRSQGIDPAEWVRGEQARVRDEFL